MVIGTSFGITLPHVQPPLYDMSLHAVKRKLSRLRRSMRAILSHPLTQRDKTGALVRYVRFHLAHAFFPDAAVYQWIGGLRFYARPGYAGITGNIYMGLADFEVAGFLLHFLRENDVFCDVGANVGAYTLLASGLRKARTIAVEPIEATFEMLQRNLLLNNIVGLVSARNIAVGANKSRLMFTADLDAMNRVALGDDKHQGRLVEVEVVPLDDILQRTTPLLLKVDVEGFEPQVLAGATRTLSNPALKAIIIETVGHERRYGYASEIVHETLVRNGFSLHDYEPFSRRIERCSSPQEEKVRKFNSLYLRDLEFVKKRISEASPVELLGSRF